MKMMVKYHILHVFRGQSSLFDYFDLKIHLIGRDWIDTIKSSNFPIEVILKTYWAYVLFLVVCNIENLLVVI